jgi:hypothetical protein
MTSISEEMQQYIIHSKSSNGITTKYLRFGINIIIIKIKNFNAIQKKIYNIIIQPMTHMKE